jgi:hypothetical protein
LGGGSPGPGVVAFQVPITFKLGETLLEVTTPENVARTPKAMRGRTGSRAMIATLRPPGPAS